MSNRDQRKLALDTWARDCLVQRGAILSEDFTLQTASDDASFRRYFRSDGDPSFIFVDAPPEQEDSRKFVSIDEMIRGVGLNSPEIIERDFDNGFLMMEDLGNTLYLDRLNVETCWRLSACIAMHSTRLQECNRLKLSCRDTMKRSC